MYASGWIDMNSPRAFRTRVTRNSKAPFVLAVDSPRDPLIRIHDKSISKIVDRMLAKLRFGGYDTIMWRCCVTIIIGINPVSLSSFQSSALLGWRERSLRVSFLHRPWFACTAARSSHPCFAIPDRKLLIVRHTLAVVPKNPKLSTYTVVSRN